MFLTGEPEFEEPLRRLFDDVEYRLTKRANRFSVVVGSDVFPSNNVRERPAAPDASDLPDVTRNLVTGNVRPRTLWT